MTVANPPFLLNAISTGAGVWRQALGMLVLPGVATPDDMKVTASGTPDMNVHVAAGYCFITGSDVADQGSYGGLNDASITLAVTAADPTDPRIDLVVAVVSDADYSGSNTFDIVMVDGTPAGSPTAPTAPDSSLVLARVAVGAAATTITSGNITDYRTFAAAGIPPVTRIDGSMTSRTAISTAAPGLSVATVTVPSRPWQQRVNLTALVKITPTVTNGQAIMAWYSGGSGGTRLDPGWANDETSIAGDYQQGWVRASEVLAANTAKTYTVQAWPNTFSAFTFSTDAHYTECYAEVSPA